MKKNNRMVVSLFTAIALSAGVSAVHAQSGIYGYWFYRAAGTSHTWASGFAADVSTNCYVIGQFSSATTINGTTLNNPSGWPNILLLKFKLGSTNAPQWIKAPATDYAISDARIGCDANFSANIYVAGSFGGTNLTFGTSTLTNYENAGNHSDDIFLVKYDTSGNFKFLTQAGGTAEDALGDMVTDTSGNCYLTGAFQSPSFSAGSSNVVRQSASGGDCFTLKYDFNGNVLWLESGSYAQGTCIALDSANNCYVGGTVLGPSVFDGLNPSNQITTNFLAKYTSAGTLVWVRGDIALGKYIRLDKTQNIYTSGTFSNTVRLGTIALTNDSAATVFLAKYDTNGNVLWANQFIGLGNDNVTGMAIDTRSNCWITGYFASGNSPTNPVAFVARFDPLGNLNAFSQANPNYTSTASGVAFGSLAGVIPLICGSYSTNFTLGRTYLTNSGNLDICAAWCMISPAISAQATSTNVILSWPAADSTGYMLQTNSDLSSGNWINAGGAVLVNGQMVVTNTVSSGVHFFRLTHP